MTGHIALIGFGEAASTFARAGEWRARASTFDIRAGQSALIQTCGVLNAATAQDALGDASCVLSLVTADQALVAATEYATHLAPGTLWLDMNSVAPDTKREAASIITAANAQYVDVAILAPVDPGGLNVPLLLAGAAAEQAQHYLADLGFTNIRIVGDEVGRASAIKMIRSVMVKGIEALTDEMMAAAEAAGVTEDVLASLDASEKRTGWRERADYNRERMATHGLRRAAEMEESAKTLEMLGVDPVMTCGTVQRQRDAAIRAQEKRNEPA